MGEQTRRLNDLERDHDSFCEQVRQMAGDTTTTYTPANKSYDELLRKQLRDGDKVLDNPIFPRNESFSRLNNRSNEININHTAGSGSSIMNQNIEDKLFFLDRKVNDMQKLLNRSAQRENEMLSIIKDLEARQSELFRAIVQLNDRNERNMDRILNSISSISKQRQIQSSLTNGYSSRNMLDDDERSSYNEYEPLDDNNSINSSKKLYKMNIRPYKTNTNRYTDSLDRGQHNYTSQSSPIRDRHYMDNEISPSERFGRRTIDLDRLNNTDDTTSIENLISKLDR